MGRGIKKTSDMHERCEKKYGGKYSLIIPSETVEYDSMVFCKCNIHNEKKYVNLRHFLAGESCGCRSCVQEKERANEKENYIKRFVEQWGDGYSFDKLDYKTWRDSGVVTCKIHGDFLLDEIRYAFDKTPCPVCRELEYKKNRNEEYLIRLKEKYGEQYTWLTTDFGDYYKDNVDFICPVHGKVSKTLSVLLNTDNEDGLACPKCIKEQQNIKQSYTLEGAIAKAKEIESCKYYDFSSITEWRGVKETYIFKCKKHGDTFQQTFDSILNGHHCACPSCVKEIRERIGANQSLTQEEFLQKAKLVHGNKFDLSLVNYVNYKTSVKIICPKHGLFDIKPESFLYGHGCKKCRESLLETKIRVFLENNNIDYVYEKSVRDLTGKMKGLTPQRVDFFLPKYNLCIECQGQQHFKPSKFNTKMTDETAKNNYECVLSNDKFKYEALTKTGFDVIYFTKLSYISGNDNEWYADKKCFYDTESLLQYIENRDYAKIKIDWYNKEKYILVPFKKTVKTIWNEETCQEEAKKYKTRTEFARANQTAYGYACRNKWIDTYDWFVEVHHMWTYEECYNEAKKYKTNASFDKGSPKACRIARKHGWIKDYVWFEKLKGFWTYERCYEEAKKYKTKKEFSTNAKGAYEKSTREKWVRSFTWLENYKGVWTYERCYEEAKKYKKRKEFSTNAKGAYEKSRKKKWLNSFTWLEK